MSSSSGANELGGIDLTSDKALFIKNDSQGAIEFNVDPAMLVQWQNAPGIVIGKITIEPLKNVPKFLGIN